MSSEPWQPCLQLWKAYLTERRAEVRGLALDNPRVVAMNNTYERALVTMHKMPRIWLDYLDHLMGQFLLTQTRRAFDRALASLPITQHDRIWQLYLVSPFTETVMSKHHLQTDALQWFLVYAGVCDAAWHSARDCDESVSEVPENRAHACRRVHRLSKGQGKLRQKLDGYSAQMCTVVCLHEHIASFEVHLLLSLIYGHHTTMPVREGHVGRGSEEACRLCQ